MDSTDFSDQFRILILQNKRQSACLVVTPITVNGYAQLFDFNCIPVSRTSDSMMAPI